MKTINSAVNRRPRARKIALLLLAIVATSALAGCGSPYASMDVSVPFKVGPVYVEPSIGVGGFL